MLKPSPDFSKKLLEILLTIDALNDQDNRSMLLQNLPQRPVSTIHRSQALLTDLNNIIRAVESWGQLKYSDEWAVAIVARNALRFATETQPGREIEALLAELEPWPSDTLLAPIEEIVIGQDERIPASFLERGLLAGKAVAKVLVPQLVDGTSGERIAYGTGWLIALDLLITNYHVIEARNRREEPAAKMDDFKAQALKTTVWFDYLDWEKEHSDYGCIELVHFDARLDYALLRLSSVPISGPDKPLSTWGYLSFPKLQPRLIKGTRLNIIQHPQGGPKRFAIRSNFYVDAISAAEAPHRIRYLTDTEPGSSGSPVFTDAWQVIALHHASVQVPETQYKGEVVKYNNQGVLIHAILERLPDAIRQEIQTAQKWG
jgi:V8-like Glu-specific endopeptidase